MSLLPVSVIQKVCKPKNQVNCGLNFEGVNVDLEQSVFLKPIYATWSADGNV